MGAVTFPVFVDALDAALRSWLEPAVSVALEEQISEASWIRDPFRAGVQNRDGTVRAWVGLAGFVAREFDAPLTLESARQLGREFATLLNAQDGNGE